MIQEIREWLFPGKSRVAETPEEDPREFEGEVEVEKIPDSDIDFFELDDKDTTYFFVIDAPVDYIGEVSKYIRTHGNFDKANFMFMKGKMGQEVEVVETSPKNLFPNKFCNECGTAKLYDKSENETYCPFCSE